MREIVENWEKQYNEGTLFIANSITFGEYVKQWLKGRKLYINPNTLKSYEVVAEAHIIPLLGDVKLTALTRQHIQNYYESFADTLTVNTMKKHHVVIHGALESAVLDGIVSDISSVITPTASNSIPLIWFNVTKEIFPFSKGSTHNFSDGIVLCTNELISDDMYLHIITILLFSLILLSFSFIFSILIDILWSSIISGLSLIAISVINSG